MAKEESIAQHEPGNGKGETPLRIRRGRVDSVDLYEVKDSELDLLEKGSPGGFQLNFAVFLLSLAFSSIVSLCTADFKYPIVKTGFVVVVVVGVLFGSYLLIFWTRTRASISRVIRQIRERIPEEGLSTQIARPPELPSSCSDLDQPVG